MVSKKIKKRVAFVGFWDTFDVSKNSIYRILEKHYDIELCDCEEADYSICSLFNNDFINSKGVRILYTAEAIAPDFTLFDYCIGFDELQFGDRYIRIPNYLMNQKYEEDINLMLNRHTVSKTAPRQKFCAWVCSNGNGDEARDVIFDKLSQYKRVDSAGCYRNNIGISGRVPDKRKFQEQYKFALATENTSYRGYTTEKLVEAFSAGCIPIYWGDPDVVNYFNPKAFVNLNSFSSLEDGLEEVKRIDKDNDLYYSMLAEKVLNDEKYIEKSMLSLERFLIHIFDAPIDIAYRRPKGQSAQKIENAIKFGLKNEHGNTLLTRVRNIFFENRND